jgi:hypothetical protein
MANPFLYQKRYSAELKMANPKMTQELYMEGYDRANSLVNTMIGIANEVARIAISDGIDAIKQAGLYRQKTKQLCRETFRRQEHYEAIHNSNFGDRLRLWLDYLDGTEDEYRRHIFNVYMAVKMALDRHKQKDTELKARLECGRICAELAVGQYDALMKDLKDKFGADYSPLFSEGRYDKPLHTWRQLCDLYIKTDDPNDFIDLNNDPNLRLAADVLARKLSDSDILNRIGKHAIELNLDTARKYASEEDMQALGIDDSGHITAAD